MAAPRRSKHTGIEVRHSESCPSANGKRCSCSPKYRANIYSACEGRLVRKTFSSLAEAKAWRSEADVALRNGTMSGALTPTLADAADAWLEGAQAGSIRNRSGDVYKPSAIRGYEQALRLRVVPELGPARLSSQRGRSAPLNTLSGEQIRRRP